MRDGIRGSVTTACPSAASVGARTIASNTASMNASCPKTATPARAPATIVSGSPIASRRRGTRYWRRRATRSIREASEKSTPVSVASATQRTDSLRIVGSSQPSTSVLARMPPATNTIAGVITDPRSLRETAAYASTRSAIATRPEPLNPHAPPGGTRRAQRSSGAANDGDEIRESPFVEETLALGHAYPCTDDRRRSLDVSHELRLDGPVFAGKMKQDHVADLK